MESISHLLATPLVSSLLLTHPNDLYQSAVSVPPSWRSWWEWAASPSESDEPKWKILFQYYTANAHSGEPTSLPNDLCRLLDDIRRLQIPRNPIPIQPVSVEHAFLVGMSPKKVHEVTRMTGYIAHLLATNPHLRHVRHVVDVGAGQVRPISLLSYILSPLTESRPTSPAS
jgi:hypothetical protein